ncbi:uncharacterized protein LOC112057949 [Bicyclus anynana]|uniref:Uncharacterized protein LOC112057949 n=1 Tax=Bicyclus anynana TaxID=110368 RepID=A0A6J1P931_BICAN|nr:uncharacterized protein LOC112057949 [Bicyclus anynana]
MQRNPAYGSFGFQSYPKTAPPIFPQIVGEGDVTAITYPDGSVQFYFFPTFSPKHASFPYNVNNMDGRFFPFPTNTEMWFVRNISSQPNLNISVPPGNFNVLLPNTFGECPPYSPPNYYMNAIPPAYHEYTQKFHNDAWTSTTDIHYFYPSLRRTPYLQYCAVTQTEPDNQPLQNNIEWKGDCHCRKYQETVQIKNQPKVQFRSSHSCMSVDSESELEQRRNKKHKRNKSTSKDIVCHCKRKLKDTSNKLITTYADQATENVPTDGRETQTNRGDIKTQKPNNQKRQVPRTRLYIKSSSSESSCFCGNCSCSNSKNARPEH